MILMNGGSDCTKACVRLNSGGGLLELKGEAEISFQSNEKICIPLEPYEVKVYTTDCIV